MAVFVQGPAAVGDVVKAEIFKIKSGKIRQIEALINQVPYRMPSGW